MKPLSSEMIASLRKAIEEKRVDTEWLAKQLLDVVEDLNTSFSVLEEKLYRGKREEED